MPDNAKFNKSMIADSMRIYVTTVTWQWFNTLRSRQNGRHFPDIFKCIFMNENLWILIKISLRFVPKHPINDIPALVQIMAWHQPGLDQCNSMESPLLNIQAIHSEPSMYFCLTLLVSQYSIYLDLLWQVTEPLSCHPAVETHPRHVRWQWSWWITSIPTSAMRGNKQYNSIYATKYRWVSARKT